MVPVKSELEYRKGTCALSWCFLNLTNWQQSWAGVPALWLYCGNGGANHGIGLWDQCL